MENCPKNSEAERWKKQVTTNERKCGEEDWQAQQSEGTRIEFDNCEDAAFLKEGGMSGLLVFQNIRPNRKLQGDSRTSFPECSLSYFCDYKNPCVVNPLQRIPSRKARTHHLIHSLSLPPSRDF
jgi:hypothetical protein